MWTDTGSTLVNICANAYGTGQCLKSGSGSGYAAVKTTVSAKPTDYSAATMPWDLADSFGTATLIPIPTIPASFYPGQTPISALANGGGAVTAAAAATTTKASSAASTTVSFAVKEPVSSSVAPSVTPASSSSAVPSSEAVYTSPTSSLVSVAASSQASQANSTAPSEATSTGKTCRLKRRYFRA